MALTFPERTTHFRNFAPSPELAPYISCYWVIMGENHNPASKIRVLPDGCMDIIFDLNGGLAPLDTPGAAQNQPTAFVTGTSCSPTIIPLPAAPRVIGVRFNPGGAPPLLGIRADELTEGSAPLMDILPDLHRLGTSYIGEMSTPKSMAQMIDRLLLERLPTLTPMNDITTHAVHTMWHQPRSTKVNTLVRNMGVNHKRLERTLQSHAGLTPKKLARTIRFIHAAQKIQAIPATNLVQLAAHLGYTDQAHFNREFKAMSGLTPTNWATEQTDVDFLQYTPLVLG